MCFASSRENTEDLLIRAQLKTTDEGQAKDSIMPYESRALIPDAAQYNELAVRRDIYNELEAAIWPSATATTGAALVSLPAAISSLSAQSAHHTTSSIYTRRKHD